MASSIDATQPPALNPTTAAMRANMAAAKAEIEALQANPNGPFFARVGIATDWSVPINNGINYTEWDDGLGINSTGSTDVWNAATPSRLIVPTGFTKARLVSCLRLDDAAAATSYINHIAKNGGLSYPGSGFETGDRSTAGALNIGSQTSWLNVIAGDYFETFVLNPSASAAVTIIASLRSWFQIELMR